MESFRYLLVRRKKKTADNTMECVCKELLEIFFYILLIAFQRSVQILIARNFPLERRKCLHSVTLMHKKKYQLEMNLTKKRHTFNICLLSELKKKFIFFFVRRYFSVAFQFCLFNFRKYFCSIHSREREAGKWKLAGTFPRMLRSFVVHRKT